jgi:hypothetical protein
MPGEITEDTLEMWGMKTPAENGGAYINKMLCCKRVSGAEPGLMDRQSPIQYPVDLAQSSQ